MYVDSSYTTQISTRLRWVGEGVDGVRTPFFFLASRIQAYRTWMLSEASEELLRGDKTTTLPYPAGWNGIVLVHSGGLAFIWNRHCPCSTLEGWPLYRSVNRADMQASIPSQPSMCPPLLPWSAARRCLHSGRSDPTALHE